MGNIFGGSGTMNKPVRPVKRYIQKSAPTHNKKHEESLQLRACNYVRREYPHVIFFCDFAAGLNLTDNQRKLMMQMRSIDGLPDFSMDYPSRGYHGLRLEFKKEGTVIYKKDGSLRKQPYTRKYKKNGKIFIKRGDHLQEQEWCLKRYNELGYFARFSVGYDKFTQIIDWYMCKPKPADNEALF
jgi:hypothetical protein